MGRLGNSNSNNHSLQPRYAEYHLWTHNTSNPEADGLQLQKTTPVAAPVNEEQETEATIRTGSPILDNRKTLPGLMSLDSDGRVRIWSKEHFWVKLKNVKSKLYY